MSGGLVADIQTPDIETKVAILNKKAEAEKINLPLDVAFFIANNSEDSIRSLRAPHPCRRVCITNNTPITTDLVKQIMSHIIRDKNKRSH